MDGKVAAIGEADPAPYGGAPHVFFTGVLLGLVPLFSVALREQHWISETIILARLLFAVVGGVAGILCVRLIRLEGSYGFRLQTNHVWHFFGYGVVSIALVNFFYLKSLEMNFDGI